MVEDIMVSVLCTAYNHEKYIRRCLDGFVMQKTKFKFEVLINDDASTDNTAEIIREYEKEYPDIIKPIYQVENQFSMDVRILDDILFAEAKGKYIAICEGDDYWIDPLKLQKQIDALEDNLNCQMAVCRVSCVSEDEQTEEGCYPPFSLKEGVITSDRFLSIILKEYAFQTSGYVFRSEQYLQFVESPPEFVTVCPVGDEAYMLYFGTQGDVYYCEDTMSCYRHGSVGSWNEKTWSNKLLRKKYYLGMAKTYESFDKYTSGKYHEQCIQKIFLDYYLVAEKKDDFRKLLNDKRKVFRMQQIKIKIRVLIGAYCLPVLKIYNKTRNRL